MILAGRLGNAGYWIDDNSGKWATTSYYTYYNPLIDQINGAADSYSNQIWNTQWKPLKRKLHILMSKRMQDSVIT